MKCKDCYHFDVCNNYLNDFREIGFLLGHNLNAIGCRFFKDKSKIIEPPCKCNQLIKQEIETYKEEPCEFNEGYIVGSLITLAELSLITTDYVDKALKDLGLDEIDWTEED